MGEIPYRWRTGSPSDTDALSIQGDSLTLSYPCSSDPESDQDSLHVHGYPPPSAGSQFDSFLDHFEDTPYVPPRHLQLLSLQLYPSTAQSVSYGTTLQSVRQCSFVHNRFVPWRSLTCATHIHPPLPTMIRKTSHHLTTLSTRPLLRTVLLSPNTIVPALTQSCLPPWSTPGRLTTSLTPVNTIRMPPTVPLQTTL